MTFLFALVYYAWFGGPADEEKVRDVKFGAEWRENLE
jgi:hypothetical protein